MVRSWGFDPQIAATLKRLPEPANYPGDWATPNDYPSDLAAKGAVSVVNFRLNVDAEGNVSTCHIQRGYTDERFSTLVCRLIMKRARFKPALDANENPISWYYLNTVRFALP